MLLRLDEIYACYDSRVFDFYWDIIHAYIF